MESEEDLSGSDFDATYVSEDEVLRHLYEMCILM